MCGTIMIRNIIKKEDYIGYDVKYILEYLNKTYKNKSHKRFLLIHGKPGTGKSTLIRILGNEEHLTVRGSNASDQRKIRDIKPEDYLTSGFNKNTIILLDECDGLQKTTWKKIEKISKINSSMPIILIANDINKIPDIIKKNSIHKEIKVDIFKLRALGKQINENENLGLSTDDISDIANKCQSYRCIINFLKYNHYEEIEISPSMNAQILTALHGKLTQFKTGDLRNVTTIIHDNVKSSELISLADFWYARYEKKGYTYGKNIAVACLNAIRAKKEKLDYPRTYSLIHNARKADNNVDIKSNKTKRKMPNISIIGLK